MNFLESYPNLISAIGFITLLHIVQLIVLDITGILSKHQPGSTVAVNHDSFLFRASRAFGNTNETIAIFILASLFCVFVNASPFVTEAAAWSYVLARVLYAVCYYANFQLFRSIVLGVSLISLIVLYAAGLFAWWGYSR